MSKCDGCTYQRKKQHYKRDDYISNCRVDWFNIGLTRKHCPCKECLIKANCTSYCDPFSNFYYKVKEQHDGMDRRMPRVQQTKKKT